MSSRSIDAAGLEDFVDAIEDAYLGDLDDLEKPSRPDIRSEKADPLLREMAENPRTPGHTVQAINYSVKRTNHDRPEPVDLAEPEGTPGTKFYDGFLNQEPTSKYRPFQVRGSLGNPGLYEELYRKEPVIRQSVDSIVQMQKSAIRKVEPPSKEHFNDQSQHETLVEWSKLLDRKVKNIRVGDGGRLNRYVENATNSTAVFGFAPFEAVWEEDDETGMFPHKLGFREPQTVWQWLMNDREDVLLGGRFKTGDGHSYTLSRRGESLADHQLLLCRISGRGNNWEGISPIRPAIHWVKFKKLLAQIAAATAQKYGVPITWITQPNSDDAFSGVEPDQEDVADVIDKIDAMEALDAVAMGLPRGLEASVEGPPGSMPQLMEMFDLADQNIVKPFFNEGSLLGSNQAGAFNLGEMKENKFVQSAPMWSQVIMQPINRVLELVTRANLGPQPAYPKMAMRLDSLHDVESFVESMVSLFGPNNPVTRWPEKARRAVERQMGLEESTLDPGEDRQSTTPVTPGQNSSQTGVDNVEPFPGSSEKKNIDLSEPEDRVLAAIEQTPIQGDRQTMEQIEQDLAGRLNSIAADQRGQFRDQTAGLTDPTELDRQTRRSKEQFKPEYKNAIREEALAPLLAAGVASIARDVLDDAPARGDLDPQLSRRNRDALQSTLDNISSEIAARNAEHMRDQRNEQIGSRTEDDRSVDKLKQATIAGVAALGITQAFNLGRSSVLTRSQNRLDADPDTPRSVVYAGRVSVNDSNTCSPCRNLDVRLGGPTVQVGSARYWRILPPAQCRGRHLCRCMIIHTSPPGFDDAVRRTVERFVA